VISVRATVTPLKGHDVCFYLPTLNAEDSPVCCTRWTGRVVANKLQEFLERNSYKCRNSWTELKQQPLLPILALLPIYYLNEKIMSHAVEETFLLPAAIKVYETVQGGNCYWTPKVFRSSSNAVVRWTGSLSLCFISYIWCLLSNANLGCLVWKMYKLL
jgi:hypothetical protein